MTIAALPIDELLGPLNRVERKNAPEVLFFSGDKALLKVERKVSVVGSREASEKGLRRAAALSKMLVQSGVIVISGLARGIDAVAHQTAIEAGGRTIAVLGTPLNEFYPKENKSLQELIMREHLAVSQFEPGVEVGKGGFPQRNRTMALVSDAAVIVEASEKSGTIHLGWEALRLGRPLFLMESIFEAPGLLWPNEMIKYGAEVLSRDTFDLLIETLPETSRDERSDERSR